MLAPAFLAEMQRRYGDTPMGQQELEGEIVDERMTGLWRRAWLDQRRLRARARADAASWSPSIRRSPPTAGSDSCGIIVAGMGVDGRAYVIGDRTLQGRDPASWAKAAVAAYHDYQADRIVAETNQGGDLVVQTFKSIDAGVPVKKVHATRGKYLRAEPVSALYAEGRVAHVGEFPSWRARCATSPPTASPTAKAPTASTRSSGPSPICSSTPSRTPASAGAFASPAMVSSVGEGLPQPSSPALLPRTQLARDEASTRENDFSAALGSSRVESPAHANTTKAVAHRSSDRPAGSPGRVDAPCRLGTSRPAAPKPPASAR